MIDLKLILHPTDFTDYSRAALPYVRDFASRFGASVLLVHVVDIPLYAASYEIDIGTDSMRDTMRGAAAKQIETLAEELRAEGAPVETLVLTGTGSQEVLELARERDPGLIILSTHGRRGFSHLLMGSTAERILQGAPCPVLTVRHPEHEFVHP